LSISKWIHLNHGDEGILRFFRKMYNNLNHGGLLVFEPQDWKSYKKKSRITQKIKETYQQIKIFPNQFESELTNLGFSLVDRMQPPEEGTLGFQRSIMVFKKKLEKQLIVHCPRKIQTANRFIHEPNIWFFLAIVVTRILS